VEGAAQRSGDRVSITAQLFERSRFVDLWSFALVHAGLGDKDEAFKWSEKAYEERSQTIFVPDHAFST
jgi:TolB-like protein